MRKLFTRAALPLLLILIACVLSVTQAAPLAASGLAPNRLDALEIEVTLNGDGSASILETWRIQIGSGTEVWKPFSNLQDARISDFTVREGDTTFQNVVWKSELSREQKAGLSGILETKEGVELCWGFGSFGYHTFEIGYTVSNFVQQYQDYHGIYWQFVQPKMNLPLNFVRVAVQREGGFDTEETRVWAFGFSGAWELLEGAIVAESDRPMASTDFVELMIRMPLEYLQSSSLRDKTFSTAMAEFFDNPEELLGPGNEGRSIEEKPRTWQPNLPDTNRAPFQPDAIVNRRPINPHSIAIFTAAIVVLAVAFSTLIANRKKRISAGSYAESLRQDLTYDPDLSLGGDIMVDYWLLKISEECTELNLIRAFLVRWLQQGYLKAVGAADATSQEERIDVDFYINSTGIYGSAVESQLFNLLLRAADLSGRLSAAKFHEWCDKHADQLLDWVSLVNVQARERALELNYITRKRIFLFSVTDVLTPEGEAELLRLLKLKEYLARHLEDHLPEDNSVEAWNEYLFYAVLFDVNQENEALLCEKYPEGALAYNNMYFGLAHLYGYSRIAFNAYGAAHMHQMMRQGGAGMFGGGGGGISSGGGGGMGGGSSGGGGVR